MNKFDFYSFFCDKCGRYSMRLLRYGKKICIYCSDSNQDLQLHYPQEEIEEFLSTQEGFIDEKGKVFKEKKTNDIEGGRDITRR